MLNNGNSMLENMVITTMIAIVDTIGPIELLAKDDNRIDKELTVDIAKTAKR